MKLNELLRSRPGINTAIGVLFAIIAGLLLLGYISRLAKGNDDGPLLDIPVARADIEMGAVVKGDMISTRKVPSRYVVPGTIKKRGDISGGRAIRFIGRGEPFTASAVAGPNGKGTLASRIPSDLRAYSLQLGRGSGAADLRPGDRVDVIATTADPPKTSTLLRDRFVLSVQGTRPDDEGGETSQGGSINITLLVSPQEAEMLAQAECLGEISVSLCPIAPEEATEK
jgi:pilus assembly protein CpaB